MGRTVVHQGEQELLGENVDLQGFAALGNGGVHQYVGDPPSGADGEVVAVLGRAHRAAGAHGGNVRVIADMGLKDVIEGQVYRQVTPGQHHVVLPDVLQIGAHARQGVHAAPVDALPPARVAEGGRMRRPPCLRLRSQSLPEPT